MTILGANIGGHYEHNVYNEENPLTSGNAGDWGSIVDMPDSEFWDTTPLIPEQLKSIELRYDKYLG